MLSHPSAPVCTTFFPPKRIGMSIAILLTYFGIRFGLNRQLDQLGEFASYLFEVSFVAIVGFYYWRRLRFSMPPLRRVVADGIIGLMTGFLVYKLAGPLSLTIPFQLQDKQTIALLLIVAPCLEEALFRMAIWEPLEDLFRYPWAVILSTSLIFSFAHFYAWWSVPEQFHAFVLYQTIYVFFLAFYCGLRRSQSGSMLISVLVHFGFNLGFYFGFLA